MLYDKFNNSVSGGSLSFDEDMFSDITPSKAASSSIGDEDVDTIRYWIYFPGDNACKWEEFHAAGIMGLGWSEIGDLNTFGSKEAMKIKMKEVYGEEYSYKNAALATWQFANEMKPE